MEHLEYLAEQMEDELDSAEHYAQKACKYRETHPTFAKHLHDMAIDELRHGQYISDAAHEYVKDHQDHPEYKQVWDFVKRHADKQIERINDILVKYRATM